LNLPSSLIDDPCASTSFRDNWGLAFRLGMKQYWNKLKWYEQAYVSFVGGFMLYIGFVFAFVVNYNPGESGFCFSNDFSYCPDSIGRDYNFPQAISEQRLHVITYEN